MVPDRPFRVPPSRFTMSGAPPAERSASLEREVMPERVTSEAGARFSSTADACGVTPANMDELIEHLPVGVLIVDRDGRMTYANAAARALKIERLETVQWAVTRSLLTEDAVREDEIQVVTPGQPRRWLSTHVLPVRTSGLGVTAALVTLCDVTAKARMKAWDPVIESLVNL